MTKRAAAVSQGEDRLITVTHVSLDSLIADPANVRVHSSRQLRMLANAIRDFQVVSPIIVGENLTIISGHARLEACRRLGWKTIPTICVDHLDEASLQAFALADNRIAELATSGWS